ncbi:helix-turn-helix domain-containing protein [Actinomadura sp. HBU206391]|uniref:helix-turn-helix domain-containing protein n=1 Tax=Actinomadura sp. HBU206391 TaxID=2731692 RepID=UPI001650355F|nr:helix-turn-helix transcriptional regulator [Actinomadura sp. HBU206391]MBC6461711.1 helix-turn-helix domain-containing protein [Actinomadura sp. HBU206391]
MPEAQSPTVHQRRLRVELRKARDAAGLTQEQVASTLEWSLSKVIRIEAGAVRISITDVRALLQHYEIPNDRIAELVDLARAARERAWWSDYTKVLSPQYLDYVGYEAAASTVRVFNALIIPGLLQTTDYADALALGVADPNKRAEVSAAADVRVRRQELLDRDNAPRCYFVIDEAAVTRQVGGPVVMKQQLRHITAMAARPNVTVEIVPFTAGAHPGMNGPIVVLEFPDPEDDDVVYLENERGSLISRDVREDVVFYRESFERLRGMSLKPQGSAALLTSMLNGG